MQMLYFERLVHEVRSLWWAVVRLAILTKANHERVNDHLEVWNFEIDKFKMKTQEQIWIYLENRKKAMSYEERH